MGAAVLLALLTYVSFTYYKRHKSCKPAVFGSLGKWGDGRESSLGGGRLVGMMGAKAAWLGGGGGAGTTGVGLWPGMAALLGVDGAWTCGGGTGGAASGVGRWQFKGQPSGRDPMVACVGTGSMAARPCPLLPAYKVA